MPDPCCAPRRPPASLSSERTPGGPGGGQPPRSLVSVPGGLFRMGDQSEWAYPGDGEGPVHDVALAAFQIDSYAVTNEQFAAFVEATGWRTDAEAYGWSFVFAGLLPDEFPPTRGVQSAPWWRQVMGADWRHPEGASSATTDRPDHPVVHISWNDAQAYCAWSGTRLPTEAEWEAAARGGLQDQPFPWGGELEPGSTHRMNVFQGEFPGGNTGADGYMGTAPVGAYEPNGYGIYNMTGNVWEWCADWLDVGYYGVSPVPGPLGPPTGSIRVQRGGSYLCHASYCRRYRVSARFGSGADSSTGNLGFRVAADL
ncbi:MAG: formylglycine-generating enzyme family protein [Acidimicrobiales bacterium]